MDSGGSVNFEQLMLCGHVDLNLTPRVLVEALYGRDKQYLQPSCSTDLLKRLNALVQQNAPSAYFSFPGTLGSCLNLPPLKRWPQKNGWSFNCWFCPQQKCDHPCLLYCFQNEDGLGFTAHFENGLLIITTIRQKGKGLQHRISLELSIGKWFMLTLVYVYSRWGRGELQCYLDGSKVSGMELSWYVGSESQFNRCSVGGSYNVKLGNSYLGYLTNILGFMTALLPDQIGAIYNVGVQYQGLFRFETECVHDISEGDRRLLYGGTHLHDMLMFAYVPSACDQNLCLNRAPKRSDVFVHSSHAVMCGNVHIISHISVHGALHSLGGMQALYPLFEYLDCGTELSDNLQDATNSNISGSTEQQAHRTTDEFCVVLLDFICNLARSSPSMGRQLVQTRGLLLFATGLLKAPSSNLTVALLHRLMELARELLSVADSIRSGLPKVGCQMHSSFVFPLLRHLHTYVFCNMDVWIRAPVEVQDQLHQFLATEFFAGMIRHDCVSRASTVFQSLHVLKHYYAVVDPRPRSGFHLRTVDQQPVSTSQDVLKLRANLLFHIRQLVVRHGSLLDSEMQALLNYLLVVRENENLHDVLHLLVTLLVDYSSQVGPVFLKNDGLLVTLKLLATDDELNRIYSIKLFGAYLRRARLSKSEDLVERYHLFSLVADRLSQFPDHLSSILTYNALFEVVIDRLTTKPQMHPPSRLTSGTLIKNPHVIRVISSLLRLSQGTNESTVVTYTFLSQLLFLCSRNRSNRRTLLQLPMWQDCLLPLAIAQPTSLPEARVLACVLQLLGCLLFHAIRYERNGWRVWIDTLALQHLWMNMSGTTSSCTFSTRPNNSRVGDEMDLTEPGARRLIGNLSDTTQSKTLQQSSNVSTTSPPTQHDTSEPSLSRDTSQPGDASASSSPGFCRGRESQSLHTFVWSHLHHVLLDDLLRSIEQELQVASVKGPSNQPAASSHPVCSSPDRISTTNTTYQPVTSQLAGISLEVVHNDPEYDAFVPASSVLHDPENATFFFNLVNLLADCSDMLVCACGGLLPLLAAVTSLSGDVGIFESVEHLPMSDAITFMLRIAFLADLCVLRADFNTIEKQRNMASGTFVRKFSRLYLTAAARSCLEYRFSDFQPSYNLAWSLKSFSISEDGVRFIPLEHNSCIIELGEITNDHSRSQLADFEADITSAGDEGMRNHCSNLAKRLPTPSLEVNLESAAVCLLCLTKLMCKSDAVASRLGVMPHPWHLMHLLTVDELLCAHKLKQQHDVKIACLPGELYRLAYSLQPTLYYPVICNKSFFETVLRPVIDPRALLQPHDLNRLQGIIFKSEEFNGVSESLVMSVVYFLTAVMVSKYRDLLNANCAVTPQASSDKTNSITYEHITTEMVKRGQESDQLSHCNSSEIELDKESLCVLQQTSDSPCGDNESDTNPVGSSDTSSKPDFHSASHPPPPPSNATVTLIDELNAAFTTSASVLRDLFSEFHGHLNKRLLGSHGQALFSTGLATLGGSQSVVELVMLLCSQEWQLSLQKNGGLAFIELINEGRVSWRVMREYIVRVSQEALGLLHSLAISETKSHAEFGQLTAQVASHKREDARVCDHLITSASQRDRLTAAYLNTSLRHPITVLRSNHLFALQPGSTTESIDQFGAFYKLDLWEDDSRRRRRFSPNPYGSNHAESSVTYEHTPTTPNYVHSAVQLEAMLKRAGAIGSGVDNASDEPDFVVVEVTNGEPVQQQHSISATVSTLPVEQLVHGEGLISYHCETLESLDSIATFEVTKQLTIPCVLVSFGIGLYGFLSISSTDLQFERDMAHSGNQYLDKRVLVYIDSVRNRWSFSEIQAVFTRRYIHRTVAMEVFVIPRYSVFFAFDDAETLRRVINALPAVGVGTKYGLPQSRATTFTTPRQLFVQSDMIQRWQRREVSNFDYLMYLNTISGRTYNDMNQYPIFPWILSNYTSEQLDLSEPSNYRDLSKPIGALDPKRKAYFDERYASWDDDSQPPFHYGTHYSTAAFVLAYLLRLEPFTTLFLNLQGWRFDHPDRTFFSVGRTWVNCQCNTSDVKELIPEFFYLSEMFENQNNLDLGTTEDGDSIESVVLPPWAETSEDFVRIHRQALESELVSCQLHHWIDLIFGYKQRGPEAVQATNVFHHLTYEGSVDWSKITDPLLIRAVQDQIQSFGQTPAQLLRTPHPHRNSPLHSDPLVFCPLGTELCTTFKFQSNAPVVFIACRTNSDVLPFPAVLTVTANRVVVQSRWNHSAANAAYQSALVHLPDLRRSPISPPVINPSSENNNNAVDVPLSETAHSLPAPSKPALATTSPPLISSSAKETDVSYASLTTKTEGSTSYLLTHEPSSQQTSSNTHYLGDDFDLNLSVRGNQFVATPDCQAVLVCGYQDFSFRVYSIETGRLTQSVYGHLGVVTCLAHSEWQSQDHCCYLTSGSRDCTVKLWIFNSRRLLVVDDQASTASPLLTLIGHETEVTAVHVSAELGLIVSGSKAGTCLLHDTRGALLRQLHLLPRLVDRVTCLSSENAGISTVVTTTESTVHLVSCHREGYLIIQSGMVQLSLYTLNGKLIRSCNLSELSATPNCQLSAIIFSACGRYLLCAGTDGVIWILRSHNLTPVHAFPRCSTSVQSLCLTKDQRFLLAGLSSGSLVTFYVNFSRWHDEYQGHYSVC